MIVPTEENFYKYWLLTDTPFTISERVGQKAYTHILVYFVLLSFIFNVCVYFTESSGKKKDIFCLKKKKVEDSVFHFLSLTIQG